MNEFRPNPPEEQRLRPQDDPSKLRVDPPKRGLGKILAGIAGVAFVLFTKFKFALVAVVKFLPVLLKSGGTMVLSMWVYAQVFGWWYGVGFVLLIFIHECGHLVVARRFGLKVGAPVFIPFMGAFIALKDAPKDAWMEACVGIGGPIFGSIGAAICLLLYPLTNNPLFLALAYTGFFLNLFNLMPVGFLDGGRIVSALSPWLWVGGMAVLLWLVVKSPNLILILILVTSLPRLFSLFRKRSEEEQRYYTVSPARRWTMGVLYFGLAAALGIGMEYSHIPVR